MTASLTPPDRNRRAYAHLCDDAGAAMPLMARAWWMEAVSRPAGKEWGAVMATDGSGRLVGAMPYQLTRRGPLTAMLMPQLTQLSHIWTAPEADRAEAVAATLRELSRQMRRDRVLMAQFADRLTEAERGAFIAEGFTLEERISLRLNDLSDIRQVEAAFAKYKKRKLRKAEAQGYTLDTGLTASVFTDMARQEITALHGSLLYPPAVLNELARAAIGRGCCRLFCARAAGGEVAAAVMMVHDETTAYYLVTPRSTAYSRLGAVEWVTREAIRWAATEGLVFDFEGSMDPGIARAYMSYGATVAPYAVATWHANGLVRWLARRWTGKV